MLAIVSVIRKRGLKGSESEALREIGQGQNRLAHHNRMASWGSARKAVAPVPPSPPQVGDKASRFGMLVLLAPERQQGINTVAT
eukprot:1978014-Pleurochrysis_carterae.AAC.2